MAYDKPGASPWEIMIGTAIIAGVTGYMIGIASSLGFIPIPFMPQISNDFVKRSGRTQGYDDEEESEEEDIDEDILNHAPNWANGFEADRRDGLRNTAAGKKTAAKTPTSRPADREKDWESSTEDCKLVLVVRTDLGMTKGKIAAQCSHATLACYKFFLRHKPNSQILRRWEREGQAKVALQVKSEEELETLQAAALSMGLVAEVIVDAGRTQIEPGSHTVLGIGPAPKSVIDSITGQLKLL